MEHISDFCQKNLQVLAIQHLEDDRVHLFEEINRLVAWLHTPQKGEDVEEWVRAKMLKNTMLKFEICGHTYLRRQTQDYHIIVFRPEVIFLLFRQYAVEPICDCYKYTFERLRKYLQQRTIPNDSDILPYEYIPSISFCIAEFALFSTLVINTFLLLTISR